MSPNQNLQSKILPTLEAEHKQYLALIDEENAKASEALLSLTTDFRQYAIPKIATEFGKYLIAVVGTVNSQNRYIRNPEYQQFRGSIAKDIVSYKGFGFIPDGGINSCYIHSTNLFSALCKEHIDLITNPAKKEAATTFYNFRQQFYKTPQVTIFPYERTLNFASVKVVTIRNAMSSYYSRENLTYEFIESVSPIKIDLLAVKITRPPLINLKTTVVDSYKRKGYPRESNIISLTLLGHDLSENNTCPPTKLVVMGNIDINNEGKILGSNTKLDNSYGTSVTAYLDNNMALNYDEMPYGDSSSNYGRNIDCGQFVPLQISEVLKFEPLVEWFNKYNRFWRNASKAWDYLRTKHCDLLMANTTEW